MNRTGIIFILFLGLYVCVHIWISSFRFQTYKVKISYNLSFDSRITVHKSNYKDDVTFILESMQAAFRTYNTTPFLIEPSILKKISNNRTGGKIKLLDLNVMTFGIIWTNNNTMISFYQTLKTKGFSTMYSIDVLDKDVKPRQYGPTHIISQHNTKLTIHIVVFHRKQRNYLWHSQYRGYSITGRGLTFAKKAGIYRDFSTEEHFLDGIRISTPSPVRNFLNAIEESEFIECNLSQAEKFYAKYPRPTDDKSIQTQLGGRHIIANFSRIFFKVGIPFTMSSGSLLGWYRQCDVLPYGDVDVEVFPKDYKPELIKALQADGFFLKYKYGKINDSFELTFRTPGGQSADIFLIYGDGDTWWYSGTVDYSGEKLKYKFPKYTRCWTTLQGVLVQIPCNYKENVKAFYGSNWETPTKYWHFVNSGSNVRHNGYWPKRDWKEVIQAF